VFKTPSCDLVYARAGTHHQRRYEDVTSDVMKTSPATSWRRHPDVMKTSPATSWRRHQQRHEDVTSNVMKTSPATSRRRHMRRYIWWRHQHRHDDVTSVLQTSPKFSSLTYSSKNKTFGSCRDRSCQNCRWKCRLSSPWHFCYILFIILTRLFHKPKSDKRT
jgi:hypothetical protein